jgi:hypothetical protein
MLKAEISVPVALATAALVWGIYQTALPPLADARSVEADNEDLRGAENTALWLATATAAGVALVSGDPTPFYFGGLLAVGLSWSHRHARALDPNTGKLGGWDAFMAERRSDLRHTYLSADA